MNRDHLNLCTFDPLPMALGERVTRQPAPAVNPRAEFEAFERGDHVVPGEMIPLMRKRTPTFTVTIEASHINFDIEASHINFDIEAFQQHVAQEILAAFRLDFKTLAAKPVTKVDRQQVYNQLVDVARNHKSVFGIEATKALMLDKFGATRLLDIPDDRRLEAIALFGLELNAAGWKAGPEPDDGEGDTPDIAR